MYREFQPKRPYSDTLNSWPQESCRLYEPHISDREYYTEELLDHARDYSDTAIAVIGRFAGEVMTVPRYSISRQKGEKLQRIQPGPIWICLKRKRIFCAIWV